MLTKEGLQFLLRITDYFNGHWEDPSWGQQPLNQVLVLLSSHTLTSAIDDVEARGQIQGTIEKAMVNIAQKIVTG